MRSEEEIRKKIEEADYKSIEARIEEDDEEYFYWCGVFHALGWVLGEREEV